MAKRSPRAVAAAFARALDADDYAAAGALLAPEATYEINGETIREVSAILASYRAASERGRRTLDELAYESEIVAASEREATIQYSDHLRLGERRHTYRCQQRVALGDRGLIAHIAHAELPGEREALDAFLG